MVDRNCRIDVRIAGFLAKSVTNRRWVMRYTLYLISINVCWNEARRVRAICCMESGFSSRLENERSTTQGVDFAILKITTEYAQLFDPVEISILVAGIAEINIRPRSGNR